MKRAKRLLAIPFLIVTLSTGVVAPLAAFDFGFSIINDTGFEMKHPDWAFNFVQSNKGELSVNLNFTNDALLAIKGSGGYRYKSVGNVVSPLYDLDSLFFRLKSPGVFDQAGAGLLGTSNSLTIGRILFRDLTGQVLAHKLDGIVNQMDLRDVVFTVGVGTTALLFKNTTGILLSKADLSDRSKADVVLGPPRIAALVEVDFPNFLGSQDLAVGAAGQFDLRPNLATAGATATPTDSGSAVHSYYGNLHMGGRIAGPLSYDLFGSFGGGYSMSPVAGKYTETWGVAGMAGVDLSVILPEALTSSFKAGLTWGSGDPDATSDSLSANVSGLHNGFIAISKRGGGLVYSLQLNNLFEITYGYSFKPFSAIPSSVLNSLQFQVDGFTWLRPVAGKISDTKLINGTTETYLATEIDGRLNWRPLSDLGFSLTYGILIPNTAALNRGIEQKFNFDMVLSF